MHSDYWMKAWKSLDGKWMTAHEKLENIRQFKMNIPHVSDISIDVFFITYNPIINPLM